MRVANDSRNSTVPSVLKENISATFAPVVAGWVEISKETGGHVKRVLHPNSSTPEARSQSPYPNLYLNSPTDNNGWLMAKELSKKVVDGRPSGALLFGSSY